MDRFFRIHWKHIKTILRLIFTEFDRKTDFQNHLFGWIRFENRFLLNYQITVTPFNLPKTMICLFILLGDRIDFSAKC